MKIHFFILTSVIVLIALGCNRGNSSLMHVQQSIPVQAEFPSGIESSSFQNTQLGKGWYRTYSEMDWSGDKTRKEIETRLLQIAESQAILAANGTSMQHMITILESETGGFNFTEFLQEVRTGHIVDRRNPLWKIITSPARGETIRLSLEIDLKVEAMAGEPDPGFLVELDINRTAFESGDKMVLSLTATRDAYFTVINQSLCDYKQSVTILYPNAFTEQQLIRAGDTLRIPNAENWELVMAAPDQTDECEEMIQVIATRTQIPITAVKDFTTIQNSGFLVLERAMSAEALGLWLVNIPRGQVAIASKSYVTMRVKR